MRTLIRIVIVVAASLCIAAPSVAQIAPQHIVDQVSEAEYFDVLRNRLFTRMGHNRGYGPEHDPCRDYLFDRYTSLGLETYLDDFLLNGNTYYNVVAIHEGVVRPDEHYILIAHFDSANNPGADDNGTGTAALLEIARILRHYRFESTIIFIASDREEDGMKGSWAYAIQHRNDDIQGVINIDMIGWGPSGDIARIYGRSASNPIKTSLADALERYVGFNTVIGGELNRSDHYPFETLGIQACFLIEYDWEQNPHYHRPTDSTDTENHIDYEYATTLTRGVAGWFLENAAVLPTYLPATFDIVRGAPGFGGLPELADNDESYLHIQSIRASDLATPATAIEVEGFAATRQVSAVTIAIDSRSTGMPSLQRTELYNFVEGRWVVVDERMAGPDDEAVYVEVRKTPRRFIEPGTRRMRARISSFDLGVPFVNWGVLIDRINWILEPVD